MNDRTTGAATINGRRPASEAGRLLHRHGVTLSQLGHVSGTGLKHVSMVVLGERADRHGVARAAARILPPDDAHRFAQLVDENRAVYLATMRTRRHLVPLPEQTMAQLEERARALGLRPDELALAAIDRYLNPPERQRGAKERIDLEAD